MSELSESLSSSLDGVIGVELLVKSQTDNDFCFEFDAVADIELLVLLVLSWMELLLFPDCTSFCSSSAIISPSSGDDGVFGVHGVTDGESDDRLCFLRES